MARVVAGILLVPPLRHQAMHRLMIERAVGP